MSPESAILFKVTGRVQGVGFRAFVSRAALQYGLNGWVKNHYDGSVRGWAQGEHGLLVEFLKQIQIGNRWSNVSGVTQTQQIHDPELKSFEIRY